MSDRPKIFVTFGTRPEAIKMFPVVHALREGDWCDAKVVVTAQHREMLDQVLAIAGLEPDIDLDLMQHGQSLDALASRILLGFGEVLDREKPDRVLVHGDTLTTMMVTLSCYFRKIPVGHVEAGLRSGDIYSPWPEEVNRRVTGTVADLHFAPTDTAAKALLAENTPSDAIFVTGNTVIDALLATRTRLRTTPELGAEIDRVLDGFEDKRIIAVTAHRRENFGEGMRNIATAIHKLAQRDDVAIVYPVHPNPNVEGVMRDVLGEVANVALIAPLDYPNFVQMMSRADIILTDSGGIQEEAPSLGKPVLVMRDTTERPEGIIAGTAKLVGADAAAIVAETTRLLDHSTAYDGVARAHNPYGDGTAARKIARIIARRHGCERMPHGK